MKLLTAKGVDGHLEVPEGELRSGDTVTLLVSEPGEKPFSLSEEQQQLLRDAIQELDSGQGSDGRRLLDEIRP
ncbi:MAG: hypothetical protein R2991_08665 [Thermoanaerobaculia bacterium]